MQSVQRTTKLITLAEETSFASQELQFFDAFDSLRSCVRAIDSSVRFGRIDTAPVVSLSRSCFSEDFMFQRRICLRGGIGLASGHGRCGARRCARLRPRVCGRPSRRGSALKHLASHAGCYGACRDYGAAPPWDKCWFLSVLAGILAAIKLCLAITLSRSITSAGHSASPAVASPPLAPALLTFQHLAICVEVHRPRAVCYGREGRKNCLSTFKRVFPTKL